MSRAFTSIGSRRATSRKKLRQTVQSQEPIEKDPARVRELAGATAAETGRLHEFLESGRLPPRALDRLFRRLSHEVCAEIDCTACAACCRVVTPLLHPEDVQRLAGRLALAVPKLQGKLLRRTEAGLVFAQMPCPLLEGNRCSVYGDRPAVCRSYPHLHKPSMATRLSSVVHNAGFCPIVYTVLERLKAELTRRGYEWKRGAPA